MAVLLWQPSVSRNVNDHVQATGWPHMLSKRAAGGKVVGDVTVGGFPKNQETFARVSGYVEQTDVHSPLVRSDSMHLPSQLPCGIPGCSRCCWCAEQHACS